MVLAFFMALSPGVAQSQGASSIKQDELLGLKSDSKWHGSISMNSSKNQDQYSDSFLSTRLQISYELMPSTDFYSEILYRRPFSSVEEKVTRYGFEDLVFGLSRLLFSNQYGTGDSVSTNLSGFIEGSLPTSDASRRATLQGSTSAGVVSNTVWKRLIFSTNHGMSYNFYKYETADDFGTAYNSPYMIANGASITWRISNQLNWTNAYSLYYLKNYAGTEVNIQSYVNSVAFVLNKNFTVSAFLSWRDRVKTNNALFDDDTTYSGAGIRYVF